MQFEHGLEGAEHAGGAAHVVLHLVHAGGWLDADAAGVEGDALADQDEGLVGFLAALVVEHDQPRRLVAALGHGEEGAGAEFLELFLVEDLDLEVLEGLAQGLGLFGQVAGVAQVRRQVAEIAGEGHAAGNRPGMPGRALDLGLIGLVAEQGQLLQGLGVGLLALETIELVVAIGQALDDQAGFAVGVAALDLDIAQGQHGIAAAQGLQYAIGGSEHFAQLAV
ncbi:hypothetical protein D3C85_745210 [compost metagenome]